MTEPGQKQMNLLFLTAEQWPTFRPDVVALFGKYLPRKGINSDLVTERDFSTLSVAESSWGGGRTILCNVPRNRAGQYLVKFWHGLRVLISASPEKYQAIQVRDMAMTALMALLVARLKGIAFFYWMSFPQAEGQIHRAKSRGYKAGVRYWFPLLQGYFGRWLLYRIVLPRADHVFVQSQKMQIDLAARGVDMHRMTPVPMGVDTELARPEDIMPSEDPRIAGKRVVVYLGTLDRARQIEVLFQMLVIVKEVIPNILLVLAGDTEDTEHRDWLMQEVDRLGVSQHVFFTGWLPMREAWQYVRAAEVGLSPFPRSFLLDSASPTKAVEYMAFGLPVVVNDNPDQMQVIAESGAGLCVHLDAESFAQALLELLGNPEQCKVMTNLGPTYVRKFRNYNRLAIDVAKIYHQLV